MGRKKQIFFSNTIFSIKNYINKLYYYKIFIIFFLICSVQIYFLLISECCASNIFYFHIQDSYTFSIQKNKFNYFETMYERKKEISFPPHKTEHDSSSHVGKILNYGDVLGSIGNDPDIQNVKIIQY